MVKVAVHVRVQLAVHYTYTLQYVYNVVQRTVVVYEG